MSGLSPFDGEEFGNANHYETTEENSRPVSDKKIYLIDSGA